MVAAASQGSSALLARIEATPTAELGALYEKFPGGVYQDLDSLLAFRSLVRRSVLEDPDSILKGVFTGIQIEEIAIVWLEVDPAGFFVHLPLAENSLAQQMRRQAAFTAPREFIQFADGTPEWPTEWNKDLATAILGIAESDPREALALLDRFGIPDDTSASRRAPMSDRDRYVKSIHGEVASLLAAEDPAAAVTWARSLRSPEARQNTLISVVAAWAIDSPEAAAASFRELAGETGMSLHDLASRMSSLDPERTILFLDRFPDEGGPLRIQEFCNQLHDPESIRRVDDQLGSGKVRLRFRNDLLGNWGDRSPEAGLDWALAAPLEEQASALRALAGNLGKRYPEKATELAGQIDDPELREAFNDSLRQVLSETDPVRAIELARATGDEDALAATIEWTAYVQSMRSDFSPREVFEWTREAGVGLRSDIYEELAQRYFHEKPAEAEVWIFSMEDSYERDALLNGFVWAMASKNSRSAADWVERLPQGKDRESAVRSVLGRLEKSYPARAFTLAGEMKDHDSRVQSSRNSLRRWARRDPAAARAALEAATNLSEKERARLATWIYPSQ